VIVAITGASGSVYGIELLRKLRNFPDIESHLVLSSAGALTAKAETDLGRSGIEKLADVAWSDKDLGASLASGSFTTDSMFIAPCSMKSLAAIATGFTSTLVSRAADVVLKERRRLILLVREAPLHLVHLRNMTTVAQMGGIVFPPVPAFYTRPASVDDIVSQTVDRVLLVAGIESDTLKQWQGVRRQTD
ncbi:MAG: UbiX family flavin prenyltransferase, partial [Woeseiaceae bacterium]